ncbi:hypothetical protein EYW49_04235 [Siculibacillus lacustris]|uniref:Peptidase C14 caspase domain-containing protein n=1 Tax=Siculibacillus lacustris TaxID=1549641 RepID=A0A4Q9VVV7_9HYPH|nr:caspase family protein [Siculibacillus lacustris]TBW40399.1 hypothetical protein EYW49_04235 [Siculibacillus lacustris]
MRCLFFACLLVLLWPSNASAADAPVRRAFVVGIERYADGDVQSLARANTDARDFGHDLEQIGFDSKNITVITDLPNKTEFQKKFDPFLKSIKPGDLVVFFYSGHGLGVEATNTNYILPGNLKSALTYTKNKLSPAERKDDSVVRAKIPAFLDPYNAEEIPAVGISVRDIERQLAERQPGAALLLLDACRTILRADPNEIGKARRAGEGGSRLVPNGETPDRFLVLYSAANGEQAVESFGELDRRRNSLFTEVLRDELMRPGQSLVALAERVALAVRSIAAEHGRQQVPEFFTTPDRAPDDVYLVDTIGERRFRIVNSGCEGAKGDWANIVLQPRRSQIERHIRRFATCGTAEAARAALIGLVDSPEETVAQPPASRRAIEPCDLLAASESDRARPPEVVGVSLAAIVDPDAAVAACRAASENNPRVVRFLFNLSRAQLARANRLDPRSQKTERDEAFRYARLALEDAQKRGYVAAIHNLAVLWDLGLGVPADVEKANGLYKQAAAQGFPLAMYALARRYETGDRGSILRNNEQAYEWYAKASDAGLVDATVKTGAFLWRGTGVPTGTNPRRAVEMLQRAADAGSLEAKFQLGLYYYNGSRPNQQQEANAVRRDPTLALLWFGRAAEMNDVRAQYFLAWLMALGEGLANPQPEMAEKYWRLAAYGGNVDAEIELARRLRAGTVLAKPENGAEEAERLLERAFSQGSSRAALELARIARDRSGDDRDPVVAMRYAYEAIRLTTLGDPLLPDGSFYNEVAAGHLLAEMARNNETVVGGTSLLSKDEIDRVEKFYGQVDEASGRVKVRWLRTRLNCFILKDRKGVETNYPTSRLYDLWVWDWGREEAPTEPQMRRLEHETNCMYNQDLRGTLVASFRQAQKSHIPFADLIDEQIRIASGGTPRKRR